MLQGEFIKAEPDERPRANRAASHLLHKHGLSPPAIIWPGNNPQGLCQPFWGALLSHLIPRPLNPPAGCASPRAASLTPSCAPPVCRQRAHDFLLRAGLEAPSRPSLLLHHTRGAKILKIWLPDLPHPRSLHLCSARRPLVLQLTSPAHPSRSKAATQQGPARVPQGWGHPACGDATIKGTQCVTTSGHFLCEGLTVGAPCPNVGKIGAFPLL